MSLERRRDFRKKKKSKSSFLLSILREFLFLAIFSILEAFAKP